MIQIVAVAKFLFLLSCPYNVLTSTNIFVLMFKELLLIKSTYSCILILFTYYQLEERHMDDLVYICFCFFITQWPLSSVPKVAFVVERWPLWRGRGAVQQPFVFGVRLTFSCQKNAYFSIYKSKCTS